MLKQKISEKLNEQNLSIFRKQTKIVFEIDGCIPYSYRFSISELTTGIVLETLGLTKKTQKVWKQIPLILTLLKMTDRTHIRTE